MKRDFTKLAQRSGVSRELGEALLNHHEQLFELWHRVRDGTLERTQFIAKVEPIRQAVHALLTEAADYTVADGEKTRRAKTVRTCRQLLTVEPALWLFVTVEGIEPTNNAAEQAIRKSGVMAKVQLWFSECPRQSICRTHHDRCDFALDDNSAMSWII